MVHKMKAMDNQAVSGIGPCLSTLYDKNMKLLLLMTKYETIIANEHLVLSNVKN